MKKFYDEHPEFAKTPDIPVLPTRDVSAVGEDDVAAALRLDDIVQTTAFKDVLLQSLEETESEAFEEVFAHYAVHLTPPSGSVLETALVLSELAEATYGPFSRSVNSQTLQELIDKLDSAEKGRWRDGPAH